MAERRSLVAGVKSPDTQLEKEFVFGAKANEAPIHVPRMTLERVPFSSRIRSDIATALKKASLERQLRGIEPNSLQEIVEEALEPWLKTHGYLS